MGGQCTCDFTGNLMRQRSYYELLEVREDASPAVIKAAWQALDTRYAQHSPRDRNSASGDSPEREELARAAAVLLDPELRAQYDQGYADARGSSWTAETMSGNEWTAAPISGRQRAGRTGKYRATVFLLAIAWLSFFSILFFSFERYLSLRDNPNRHLSSVVLESGTVQLRRNRSGHYVAPGTINGHPVSFLIDTGATQVSIPAELAEQLQLRPGARSRALTANGPVEVRQTRVAQLNLGPFEFRNVSAHLNPGMNGDQVLLGMSVLGHLDFAQTGNQLTLRVR